MTHMGGNLVKTIESSGKGQQLFADGEYRYYLYRANAGETLDLSDFSSCSVYVNKLDSGASVVLDGEQKIHQGDAIQGEKSSINLKITGGAAELLVAGLAQDVGNGSTWSGTRVTPHASIKKVSKPWGHELWINGEHPGYAFKQIYIKSGTKTSLQYHRKKRETNVLFEGKAALHFKSNEAVANDEVTGRDLTTSELSPVTSIDIWPNTLHRLEALTDVVLYEVSTPHLDDVIRISDDSGRTHGRIESEHKK